MHLLKLGQELLDYLMTSREPVKITDSPLYDRFYEKNENVVFGIHSYIHKKTVCVSF